MLKKFFLVLLFFSSACPSHAWWGLTGHRVVGAIAEQYLTAKARLAIHAILGSESIAMASNWADFIKSDSTQSYLGPWHYLNVESGLSKDEFMARLDKDTAVDAFTKLNFLITQLHNKRLPADKKKMYLKLLIHIAGDIHQPLHVGHADDQGGNKIKVTWFSDPANLHSVWDDKLIDMQKLSYTEFTKAINFPTKIQIAQWQKAPIREWLFESYTLAGAIYAEINQPEPKLGYRYNFDHLQTINLQLLKAGVRLAGILNKIFG